MNRERLNWCEKHSHWHGVKRGCVDCRHEEWQKKNDLLHDEFEKARQQRSEGNWRQTCIRCKKSKAWYNFKILHNGARSTRCEKCIEQDNNCEQLLFKMRIENRIERLIYRAMKNNLSDLRNHLFETLEMVKNGKMDIGKAKNICEIAQVIINSAKVEVDFLKTISGKGSDFFQPTQVTEGNKLKAINE